MSDEVVNGVYLPPKGVYFRLYNPSWGYCIYARDSTSPYTGTVYQGTLKRDDQFFTLVPQGRFWSLQNKVTKKYLEAWIEGNHWATHAAKQSEKTALRLVQNPKAENKEQFEVVFHTELGNGKFIEGWLRCNDEGFWTPKWEGRHFEDGDQQYWSMEYEDMTFDKIVWDVKNSKASETKPAVLFTQNYTNKSNSRPEYTVSFKESVSSQSEFTHKHGLGVKTTVGGKVGIPLVAEGEVKVEVEYKAELAWGTKETVSKDYNFNQKFTAEPWSKHRVQVKVQTGDVTIPFYALYKSQTTGTTARAWGEWNGVMSWDIDGVVDLIKTYPKTS